jgi:cytochrome c oxidase cbb3-type subunit 4
MDINELRGYISLLTFATFVGICWWAYRSGNKRRFEQDALMPFLDEPGSVADADSSRVRVGGELDE